MTRWCPVCQKMVVVIVVRFKGWVDEVCSKYGWVIKAYYPLGEEQDDD